MGQRIVDDPITLIISYCHANRFAAEHLYALLAEQRHHHLELPEATLELSDHDLREFMIRYRTEIEPEIDRSSRRRTGPPN